MVQRQVRISSIKNCQSWLTFKGRTVKYHLNAFRNKNRRRICTSLLTSLGYSSFHERFWYWGDWKNIIHLGAMLSHLNPIIIWISAFNFRIQYLFLLLKTGQSAVMLDQEAFLKMSSDDHLLLPNIVCLIQILLAWFKNLKLCFKISHINVVMIKKNNDFLKNFSKAVFTRLNI